MSVRGRRGRQLSKLQEIKVKRFGDGNEDNDQGGFEVKRIPEKGNP